MKGGRKNLKRAAEEETLTLEEGQSIMQVVSLRGSNLIEALPLPVFKRQYMWFSTTPISLLLLFIHVH